MNNNNKKPSITQRAHQIINERSEEKEREYGPIGEGFERAALIASGMSGKEWDAHDMFVAMAALKLSRQSYNFKEDNMLDLVAYLQGWQNYIDEKNATGFTKFDSSQLEEDTEKDSRQLTLPFEIPEAYDIPTMKAPEGVTAKPLSPLRNGYKEASLSEPDFSSLRLSKYS